MGQLKGSVCAVHRLCCWFLTALTSPEYFSLSFLSGISGFSLGGSHHPLGFRDIFSDAFFSSLPVQRQVETSVRSKILYLIQAWAHAFRNEPKYKVVQDTYQIMKVEGEDCGHR